MLMVREVKSRYKQSLLGGLWAVIQPLMTVVVFTYLFGEVAGLPTHDIPYPIYVYAGLLGWNVFAGVVDGSATSIISNRVVVERVYCPRLLFPISSILVTMFDLMISFCMFCVLIAFYGYMPSTHIVFLPLLILLAIVTGLSLGLWLAAIAVWLRDVKFITTYLIQLLLLLTPVGYGASNIPEAYQFLITYNPMAPLVDLFRWCILGTDLPALTTMVSASSVMLVMLIGGVFFFNSLEKSFADVI